MAVSLKDLQAQLYALRELCPVLLPSVVPQGYDVEDLWGLVQTEGKQQREALRQYLSRAAGQLHKASASGLACCVCGSGSAVSVSHDLEDDESQTLRFTLFPETNFLDRTVTLGKGGFACGQCRAMRDAQRFVHFAALRLGPKHPEREALARELCLHFAAVNKAPEGVQTNPDTLAMWVQEVMSRAYALQVLASNAGAWKVVAPGGSGLVKQGDPGSALRIAQALLEGSQRKKQAASGSKQAAGMVEAAAAGSGKAQKRGKAESDSAAEAGAAAGKKVKQAQQDAAAARGQGKQAVNGTGAKTPAPGDAGASVQKKRKQAAAEEAPEAGAAAQQQQQSAMKSAKKAKAGAGASGAATPAAAVPSAKPTPAKPTPGKQQQGLKTPQTGKAAVAAATPTAATGMKSGKKAAVGAPGSAGRPTTGKKAKALA